MDAYCRTRLMLGSEGMQKLKNAHVAVFGLGGVGGYTVEALARSGVGTIEVIDHDKVSPSNLNRQILATRETLGMEKTEVARRRIASINPEIHVIARTTFFGPDTESAFDFSKYTYVVDAIDTVTGKLALIQKAKAENVPIICSMGTGNKLDPTAFRIADIYETDVCPLSRIMRKECRKRGIKNLKVLYSAEMPVSPELAPDDPIWEELPEGRNAIPGSIAFVPSVAGLILAGEVIKDICKKTVLR